MEEGIWGLVGAILGGVLSLLGGSLAEDRRHKRYLEEQARSDSRQAIIAARLVLMDAIQVKSRLRGALRKGRTWSPRFVLPSEGWKTQREVLAIALPFEDWQVLAMWSQTVERIENQAVGARMSSDSDRPPLTDFRRSQIERYALPRTEEAIAVLNRFAPGAELKADDDDDSDDR